MDLVRVIGVLEPGGAQLSALRLSVALRAHGIATVRLLAGDATAAGLALARRFQVPVEVFRVASGEYAEQPTLQWTPSEPFAAWLAPRLAGADVVHAHMVGAWWAAALAAPTAAAVVASEHNAPSWPGPDHACVARVAVPRLAAFFAHGPAAADFATALGVAPDRLHEGRSAIDGLAATPLPGLARPRLTYAGRFREDKGVDVLVEALARLRRAPTAYLVGDGPDLAVTNRQLRELGIAHRVRLPGWSSAPERYVAGSAVHVVPSREEAWSQSAVLGLGLGVPVVGAAVDGLARTLGEGRGVLVPPADPAALAAAVELVLAGEVPDPRPGLAYAARFTPSAVAAYYARTYHALVGGAREALPSGA